MIIQKSWGFEYPGPFELVSLYQMYSSLIHVTALDSSVDFFPRCQRQKKTLFWLRSWWHARLWWKRLCLNWVFRTLMAWLSFCSPTSLMLGLCRGRLLKNEQMITDSKSTVSSTCLRFVDLSKSFKRCHAQRSTSKDGVFKVHNSVAPPEEEVRIPTRIVNLGMQQWQT